MIADDQIGRVLQAVVFNPSPPPAPPAPAAAKLPSIALDPAGTVSCGFVKVQGLSVKPASTKCEPGKRVGNEGSTIETVSLSLRLLPDNAFVRYYAEKNVSGWGFKPMHSDQIRDDTNRWSASYEPRQKSDVVGGAFRHIKVNIKDKGDCACANGHMVGTKLARSNEARHGVWIRYCESGTHTVSDDNLAKVHQALDLD